MDRQGRCSRFCARNVSQRRALCGLIITVTVTIVVVVMMVLLRFWEIEARRALQYGICSSDRCAAAKGQSPSMFGVQTCCCEVVFISYSNASYHFNGTICGADIGKPIIPNEVVGGVSACYAAAYRAQPCWFDTVDLMVWNGRPSAMVLRVIGFAYLAGFVTCLVGISVWIIMCNGCNPVSNENLPFRQRRGFSPIGSGDEDDRVAAYRQVLTEEVVDTVVGTMDDDEYDDDDPRSLLQPPLPIAHTSELRSQFTRNGGVVASQRIADDDDDSDFEFTSLRD